MLYVKVENDKIVEWPLTDLQVRKAMPKDVPLPKDISKIDLSSWGYHPVAVTMAPQAQWLHIVGLDTPALDESGKYVRTFIQLPKKIEDQWKDVRRRRHNTLRDSDWTQISDSPLTNAERSEWADYRQYLRDIPEIYSDPMDIVWNRKKIEVDDND